MTTTNFFSTVQELLVIVEERMRFQVGNHYHELGVALDHLLSSGGKRIRPTVALLTGRMLGGDIELLITLAASVELLHTATLVHDDFIDSAYIRRGIETLNFRWSPAATVLTGDFFFARAAKLAAETKSVAVINLFVETLSTIVSGEIAQLFSPRGIANREHYFQRIYAKTASLFETTTQSAAILSCASDELVEAARLYGYSIGIAFQIVDDILDFTAEQVTLGKPVASDLRQGLITLPTLIYMESYGGDADIHRILNGESVDEQATERLITAIRNSGAIDRAMEEARKHVSQGVDVLQAMPDNMDRKALQDIACYIVDRKY